MTTFAYRNGVLAADTLMAVGSAKAGEAVKIARRANGDLAGAAGTAGYAHAFLEWFRGDEKGAAPVPRNAPDGCDSGVIFRREGSIEVHEEGGVFPVTAPYYARGSGRDQALGAMFAGADAETAVKAAIAHDVWTGGDVTVLRHDGAKMPLRRSKRKA